MMEELKYVINNFNSQIDVPTLINNCIVSTYTEGNFIIYLKGNYDKGYGISEYPLGVVEISNMTIDNEPLVVFNIQELKSNLQQSTSKYGKMKAKQLVDIDNIVEQQIKRDYPEEVYDGYKANDKYCYLNPSKIGVVRINNLKGCYGLTPMFKALPPLLTLETIDNTDRKNLQAKAKKVFYQKMRKEMIEESKKSFDINAVGYSQASLLASMADDVVIYTSTPLVEDLQILEPKTDPTDNNIVLSNRNRVFSALGVSFATNETKNGANVVKINYEDLLKTINKIVRRLEKIINKFYRTVCEENGFPIEYSPIIKIQDTRLLDLDSCAKLTDLLYSKIGASYQTTLETLGIDINEEVQRRKSENENGYEEIFIPHSNSYTSNSNDLLNKDENNTKNSNGSGKSENLDKNEYDKNYNQNQR